MNSKMARKQAKKHGKRPAKLLPVPFKPMPHVADIDIPIAVKIKQDLILPDESVEALLMLAPTARVLFKSATRLQILIESGDWLEMGIALMADPQPIENIAFLTNYTGDPFRLTVTFFSSKNIGANHVSKAIHSLAGAAL